MGKQWDFIIAHAKPDIAIAERLYEELSKTSKVFLASRTIKPGGDWSLEIAEAQRAARVTVALISDKADNAHYLREEIARAIELARKDSEAHRVVPVYLDGTPSADKEAPYGLGIKQGLDAKQLGGMPEIAAKLRALIAQPVSAVAQPMGTSVSTDVPTWEDLETAPRTYEVSPFDDIVLCMHPDCERQWRDAVAGAHDTVLPCIVIDTPEGGWHRSGLPDPAVWQEVYNQVDDKANEVSSKRGGSRVHLVVKAPYSLGALLGARLDPQNHKLVVYQPDNKGGSKAHKVWRPWGPDWPADPGRRAEAFFNVPAGLERDRPEESGDFAVVVDITGRSMPQDCAAAVERATKRPATPLLIRARDVSKQQGTISVPADVDKASDELNSLLQRLAETLPNATLHLFYYGPLGVLIRASAGLHLRRTPIIVWESAYPEGKVHWFPGIEFPEGKLLVGK